MSDFDLVVAGGGPVGLVTAIAARRLGLSVLVLEQNRGLPEKACGEGLMPGAVEVLERLGVSLPASQAFVGIRFLDGSSIASATFQGTMGRALSRQSLMAALDARALSLGVEILSGHTLRGHRLLCGTVDVKAQSHSGRSAAFRARLLVGADGLRSPLRRRLGLELPPRYPPRFGMHAHFRVPPWSEWVEVHWQDRAEAYVTPIAVDQVGVAVLSRDRARAIEQWPALFPALAERLQGVTPCTKPRGAGPFEQRVRGVLGPGVALVGDAAGYLDALTGEGLALGFASALALVERFASGQLARYPDDHAQLATAYYRMTGLMLAFARRPPLRRLAVRYLSRHPQLFSALLALSANTALPSAFRLGGLLRWLVTQRLPLRA
jgi:2-polyprenyl-6-methoxyphenol hydroxylase-like FAD-dependent oxidoreductase